MIRARFVIPALLLLAPGPARAEDAVALRSSARVAGEIRLGDVAQISGPNAERLGAIVLRPERPEADGWTTLSLDEVRRAVRSAPGISTARVAFSGSVCSVRQTSPAAADDAPDAEPAPAAEAPGPAVTVRSLMPGRLAAALGVSPEDVRFTFDESDRRILDLSAEGRILEVRPTGLGERTPVSVSVYERGDAGGVGSVALAAQGVVRVGVQVRRRVAVARVELRRGVVIGPEEISVEERWLSPTARPPEAAEVEGAVVRASRLAPGRVIDAGDVEPPLVVRRGQLVAVRCVAGTIVVRTTARAMENARVGDVIRFQPLDVRDRRDARSFEARVEGPGRAVASAFAERELN